MSVTAEPAARPPGRSAALLRTLPLSGVAALNVGVVIVAVVYLGRALLVPLVLAALLAFVLAPLAALLRRARIGPVRLGQGPAVVLAVLLAFAAISGIGFAVGQQATQLARSLPSYKPVIQQKARSLRMGGEVVVRLNEALQDLVGEVMGRAAAPETLAAGPAGAARLRTLPVTAVPLAVPRAATPSVAAPTTSAIGPDAAAQQLAVQQAAAQGSASLATAGLDGTTALVVVRGVVPRLLQPLVTAGVVLVFALFGLLYRADLRDRMIRLVGRHDLHRTIGAMNDAAHRLQRYFLTQLALNTGFGSVVALGLWFVGLPSPLLWGILAGLMRFVPFIGTPISILPPVLLAVAVSPGWGLALWVLGLFMLCVLIEGQVVEPLMYGHSTGLSPIAIVLSAAFWTFLWGPIGLLLATPLTVCLVVLGRHIERLSFLEVILGDRPPLDPEETFYQRALEGDGPALLAQADAQLRGRTLAEYYDGVALRGLALAQVDLCRDQLGFERLDAIHGRIAALLDSLATLGPSVAVPDGRPVAGGPTRIGTTAGAAPAGASPEEAAADVVAGDWAAEGSVLCIPGRGQLDDLAAAMAVQVLQRRGYGARVESNAVLGAGARVPIASVRLCCLSVLEDGSSTASVLYFLRRIRRRMPDAKVVVGLWHAQGSSAMLDALRAEGPGEAIITSVQELVALAHALSASRPRVSEMA